MSATVTAPRRPRQQNVKQARALKRDGLNAKEIAERMGADVTTVYTWLRTEGKPRATSLNRVAWVAFVAEHTQADDQEALRVNGHALNEAHTRALFRWTWENCNPGYFSADDFCVAAGLHIEMFFTFCEHHSLRRGKVVPRARKADGTLSPPINPWANGEGPEWFHVYWDEDDPRCLKPELR